MHYMSLEMILVNFLVAYSILELWPTMTVRRLVLLGSLDLG
jgi:hypothetical protein